MVSIFNMVNNGNIWGFPARQGGIQNSWFISWKILKWMMTRGTSISGNLHMGNGNKGYGKETILGNI